MLIRWKLQALLSELRLQLLRVGFEFCVGSEVDSLVRSLAEGSEGNPTVEGAETFLPYDRVGGVCGIAVPTQ